MNALRNILIFIFLLGGVAFGQQYTTKAYGLYQEGKYEEAQQYADSAIVSNERFNSQLWQLRGLIYRKIEDKSGDKENRNIAIESFVQARNLDEEGKYKEKIDGYLYNTVIRYYNDAVTLMSEKELESSESSYTTYKAKYIKYIDAEMNFDQNDIEFYTALGSEYLKLVSTQSGEEKTQNTAKGVNFFKEVLKIDGNQFGPNLNIGIMYYNNGADLIMNSDPLTPIEEIPLIEARAQEYFKKAMPYLEKAHQLKPDRIDVVEALTGCCYGLYGSENEEYKKYQKILDEKNLPLLLNKHKANPKDKHVIQELVRIYSTTFKDDQQYKKYAEILNNLEE